MPLQLGEPAPWFTARTAASPEFVFDTAAGRYVLMLFLPLEAEARDAALKALAAHQGLFDDGKATCFVVVRDAETAAQARDVRGLRWFLDLDGAISGRFGVDAPLWMLFDPALRSMGSATMEHTDQVFAAVMRLPAPKDHAGVPVFAPVLIAPRIFEPELCEALIGLHEGGGGELTGVMRDVGDRTVAVMDDLKKRRDVLAADPDLLAAIRERLKRRLFPMIQLSLGFQPTRIERFLVSCYDAADGGVFAPHRDNTTQGTAHRRFACSINLNDDFEGGDLRFAEFGTATYRPPVGGACVFSCSVMHEALPIRRGRRYAFLPFLHDEAAQGVQDAYQARVAAPAEARP